MLVVGLTGGIASGKSTVSSLLSKAPHSVPLIDLDLLARLAVAPGSYALKALVAHFGPSILREDGGGLNREKLGEIVFNDEKERKVLNSIVHPAVRRLLYWEVIKAWLKGCPVVVVDAPLLIEAGLWKWCGSIIVVYCSEQLQLQRLQQRNSLSASQARSRLAAQAPLASKLPYADYVIDNSGPVSDLAHQVDRTVRKLRERAGWSYLLSWLVPPWGLAAGVLRILYRLHWKQVGKDKKRTTRGERPPPREEMELKDRSAKSRM